MQYAPTVKFLLRIYFELFAFFAAKLEFYSTLILILLEIIRLRRRFIRARQPEGTAQVARTGRGAGFEHPFFIHFVGLVGVDEDIAVLVLRAGLGDAHLLMPAVLAADEIGLHRRRQVLMHAAVLPEDARRIGIVALEGLDAVDRPHHPLAFTDLLQVDQRRRPTLAAGIFLQTPAAEILNPRPQRLG